MRLCLGRWGPRTTLYSKERPARFVLQFLYGNIILPSALALIFWLKTIKPEVL